MERVIKALAAHRRRQAKERLRAGPAWHPGEPYTDRRREATRGAERLSAITAIALSSSGRVEAIRLPATFVISSEATSADRMRSRSR